MSLDNKHFGHLPISYLIIEKDIYSWAEDNEVVIIPFQNKYLELIEEYIEEATYKSDPNFWLNYRSHQEERTWKEKLKEMSIPGKPDFVAFKIVGGNRYNKRMEFYFVEYKTNGDSLHLNQINWFKKYHKLPCMVIHSKQKHKFVVKHLKKAEAKQYYRSKLKEASNPL